MNLYQVEENKCLFKTKTSMSRVRIPARSRHIQITRREIWGTSDALPILNLTSSPPNNVEIVSGFTSGMAAFKFLEHDDTKLHLFLSASMFCKNQNVKSNENVQIKSRKIVVGF